MMTKKDFIALASEVREIGKREDFGGKVDYKDVINNLADFCATQNPRFNRSRWIDYINGECGSSGGALKVKRTDLLGTMGWKL